MTLNEKRQQRLAALLVIENEICSDTIKLIAGADEAGRGPLAGPVVAAAVVMPRDDYILGIDDSKKLSEKRREALYEEIIKKAVSVGVGIVDEKTIDEINILEATKKAFALAVEKLDPQPDILLCDEIKGLKINVPYEAFVKGDAKVYSIAAASIVAKVTRDRLMREYDEKYPQYGFAKHKGYGTPQHCAALREFGITEIHRRTFVKNILGEKDGQ